jgi:hypothetical protein
LDDVEKMIFKDLNSNIKILNKNTLYLCRHVSSTEARLKNIENAMKINDVNTNIYGKQISEIKGKLIVISIFITIIISCIINLIAS